MPQWINWLRPAIVGFLCLSLSLGVAAAQDDGDTDGEMESVEEVIVVTASRTEQRLKDAPTAITVITAKEIEEAAVDDFGDILRNVPGVNVAQFSARDIQVTSRGATNSLAASQLVLVDGRSIYLDFFGFVIWEYMPANPREIRQMEVVTGPGSAVWGANAMTGVINLITKSPREMQGTSVMLGGGELSTAYANFTHAGVRDKLGFKVSGGYYEQEAYERPTGIIPGTQTPYPAFPNSGTAQPKFDLRFDYDSSPDTTWRFSTGYAGTDGIIHSGIGPFDITDASLSYFQGSWAKGAKRLGLFGNFLDGEANNLLTVGADGRPLLLGFESQTYNLDYSDTKVFADKHIVTFGGNARANRFDLTIAPNGDDRDELGVFVQDEILFSDKFRWLLGARWDDFDPIGSVVSPRTSFMFSPNQDHTFRLSFNRAFRAPSLILNFLDITIVNLVALPTGPYIFPSAARGNPNLSEEQLDAIEAGWVGSFGTNTVTLSVYRNETTDSMDFFTAAVYTAASPPPNFPLPAFLLDVPPALGGLKGLFPSLFSYRNVGEIVDQGLEFGIRGNPSFEWSWFLNYSYQDAPEVTGIPVSEVNVPPENRVNVGVAYSAPRWFLNANANYQEEAFWTDVLDSRFHGPTDSFTQVNLAIGFHFGDDRATFQINGQNILDEDVQQHVFGDIIGRKVTGQLSFRF